jgi:DNA-directed RNA polymerase I subunit RPA1
LLVRTNKALKKITKKKRDIIGVKEAENKPTNPIEEDEPSHEKSSSEIEESSEVSDKECEHEEEFGGTDILRKEGVQSTEKEVVVDVALPIKVKALILPLVESILPRVIVKEYPGIESVVINKNMLSVMGSDMYALCSQIEMGSGTVDLSDVLDIPKSYCNDIYAIYKTLGVEAARDVVVKEIEAVFDVYGIHIDRRHLSLVADYMTRDGDYNPFSRHGMSRSSSPLQKMSFESCYSYLKSACVFGDKDVLDNPSACLTVGLPIKLGTGGFDLFYDFDYDQGVDDSKIDEIID